jgi:hypothetical protein
MDFKRLVARAAGLGALVCVLAACAWVDRDVRLTYPPPSADAHAPDPVVLRPVAFVVTEGRTGDVHDVGSIRNGFGMALADVRSVDDAVAWVRGAAEREFPSAGLRVVPDGKQVPTVTARITKVDADAYLVYGADVVLDCDVAAPAGASKIGTVHGEGGAGMNWASSEAGFQESLALAVQDAARKLAAKVRDALSAYTPHP